VGKSTLFNAVTLCAKPSEVANYPFCTIDPHSALVEVPDKRLDALALAAGSKRVPPFFHFPSERSV
jgi:ribosome-binding ATPase YchF (GTP1/OBG family)